MFLILIIVPWIYISMAAAGSAALPEFKYQDQTTQVNQDIKSPNQIPNPVQDSQMKSVSNE